MSRIDFYHLQKQTLEDVLPKLLQKAQSTGKHIVVKIGNVERVEVINSWLWTYSDESFLPHGSKKDGFAHEQPIWLTSEDDNPNDAEFLFLVDGADTDEVHLEKYERVFNIFDGNNKEALTQARSQWRRYKDNGQELYYWQQNDKGAWEQKV